MQQSMTNPLRDAAGNPNATALPDNIPPVLANVPPPRPTVAGDRRTWAQACSDVKWHSILIAALWAGVAAGLALLVFGKENLIIDIAGFIFFFGSLSFIGSVEKTPKNATIAPLPLAEQQLNELRANPCDVELTMHVTCYHEVPGDGPCCRARRVVTFQEAKRFDPAHAQRKVVADDQMHQRPSTDLEIVNHGVVFADQATRDAFLSAWNDLRRAHQDRDERIEMTLEIAGAHTSASQRQLFVVADDSHPNARWFDKSAPWLSTVRVCVHCCSAYALCAARHSVPSRADVWTTIHLGRGEGHAAAGNTSDAAAVGASAAAPVQAADPEEGDESTGV